MTDAPAATKRAIVVDDDALARSVMSSMLEEAGYSVVGEATNATEALEVAKMNRPLLILLDVSMPGISGLDILPELKKELPDCDVIIVSSFELPRVEAETLGAVSSIDKAEIHLLFDLLENLHPESG